MVGSVQEDVPTRTWAPSGRSIGTAAASSTPEARSAAISAPGSWVSPVTDADRTRFLSRDASTGRWGCPVWDPRVVGPPVRRSDYPGTAAGAVAKDSGGPPQRLRRGSEGNVTVHRARHFAVGAAISAAVLFSQLAPVAAASPHAAVSHADRGAGQSQGALMVRLKAGVDDATAASLFAGFGAVELGRLGQISTHVVAARGHAPAMLRSQLLDSPLVASVEEDGTASVTLTPTDPLWSNEWYASKVKAPTAWNTTVGAGSPVVAVSTQAFKFTTPTSTGASWPAGTSSTMTRIPMTTTATAPWLPALLRERA